MTAVNVRQGFLMAGIQANGARVDDSGKLVSSSSGSLAGAAWPQPPWTRGREHGIELRSNNHRYILSHTYCHKGPRISDRRHLPGNWPKPFSSSLISEHQARRGHPRGSYGSGRHCHQHRRFPLYHRADGLCQRVRSRITTPCKKTPLDLLHRIHSPYAPLPAPYPKFSLPRHLLLRLRLRSMRTGGNPLPWQRLQLHNVGLTALHLQSPPLAGNNRRASQIAHCLTAGSAQI